VRKLTVSEKHQLAIARKTLRMSDVGVAIMGGMTKVEAREIADRLEAKLGKRRSNNDDYNGEEVE